MKLAVVGSRSVKISLEILDKYVPRETKVIISGGAKGVDSCAALYAEQKGIVLTEIKPDYKRYKRGAPLVRNKEIIEKADHILIFWDGKSKGTLFVINECEKTGKKYQVVLIE